MIIRAGHGLNINDIKFERNYTMAKNYKIPIGVYLYANAQNVEEARKEANHLLDLIIKQDKIENPYLYALMLPRDAVNELYGYLKSIGYDASRIYPGYNGVVKSLLHDSFLNSEAISKS